MAFVEALDPCVKFGLLLQVAKISQLIRLAFCCESTLAVLHLSMLALASVRMRRASRSLSLIVIALSWWPILAPIAFTN
jgi:hypothetical protein